MNKFYKQNRGYTIENKNYLLDLIMKQLNLIDDDLYLRPSDLKNKIRDNKLNIILED